MTIFEKCIFLMLYYLVNNTFTNVRLGDLIYLLDRRLKKMTASLRFFLSAHFDLKGHYVVLENKIPTPINSNKLGSNTNSEI